MYITTVCSSCLSVSRSVSLNYGARILCRMNKPLLINHQPLRNLVRMTQKTEARLKLADNIPKEYELVYRAPMISYVKVAQTVSSISVLMLTAVAFYKIYINKAITFPIVIRFDTSVLGDFATDVGTFIFLISSFMLFNVSIYAITLRYPHRIYYNATAKEYICILTGLLPSQFRKLNFNKGEVIRQFTIISSLLPWRDAIFKIGKKTVFLVENGFRTPADFSTMMSKR
ncbi:hypothetical protein C0J52_23560 [Blattella germanica]|nr:hypothetical protein C0J52_23560 [Blattella germanica]